MPKFSILSLTLLLASLAMGADYSVTTTADSGAGSLRDAITQANANVGMDTISFAIPGAGPHRITPLTNLPQISDPVFIDGYTQPGASEAATGTPAVIQIEIDGSTAAVPAGNQFVLDFRMLSETFTMQGLSIIGGDYGLYVHSGAADGSVVRGNYFGVDASGVTPVPNSVDGVYSRATGVTYGGPNPADRNVFSGNIRYGLYINWDGANCVIENNFFSTDSTGTSEVSVTNRSTGAYSLRVRSGNNQIRGNLISGGRYGLFTDSAHAKNNIIENNKVGVDVTGMFPLPNEVHGLTVGGAGFNIVRNNQVLPGGHQKYVWGQGIVLSGADNTNCVIEANQIGLDATGMAIVNTNFYDNGSYAINISAPQSIVRDNVMAGVRYGLLFIGVNSYGNTAVRNRVGVNVAGDSLEVSVRYYPLYLAANSWGNTIGGPDPADGNLFVNSDNYLSLVRGTYNNRVENNLFGVLPDGTPGPGRLDHMLLYFGSATNTFVRNTFAHSPRNAIFIQDSNTVQNTFSENVMFENTWQAIDIAEIRESDGRYVTRGENINDPLDADIGTQSQQNKAIVEQARFDGSTVEVDMTFHGKPSESFTVEYFLGTNAPGGLAQSHQFITSQAITTDAAGNAAWSRSLGNFPIGYYITATTTDADGNTSEFARPVKIVNEADIRITQTISPANPVEGQLVTLTITAENLGPLLASDVKVTQSLDGLQFVSSSESAGSYLPGGTWLVGDLAVNQSESLVIQAMVRTGMGGYTLSNEAEASGDFGDPSPANNQDDFALNVVCPSGTVQGAVFIDTNGDGERGFGELYVSGLLVEAIAGGVPVASDYTDGQGFYSMKIPNGSGVIIQFKALGSVWTALDPTDLAQPVTSPACRIDLPVAAPNQVAVGDRHPLGPSSRLTSLVLSEIMYNPAPRTDGKELEFIEIHNTQPVDAPIGGFRLKGEVKYTFPAGSVVPAFGFVVVAANPVDLSSEAPWLTSLYGPWEGSLNNKGGTLTLMHRHEWRLLEVKYDDKDPWPIVPDGSGHSLSLNRASFGERDARSWGPSLYVGGSPGMFEPVPTPIDDALVINEILYDANHPSGGFVELYNRGPVSINLTNARITDDPAQPGFTVPVGTSVASGGHVSFTEAQLGFSLDAGKLYLFSASGDRALDATRVGPRPSGVAWGLRPDGDRTSGFENLVSPTSGSGNALLAIPSIVVNEIMYNPLSNETQDEYVELHNHGAVAFDLSGWAFEDGIDFTFPAGTTLAAGGYMVVAKDAAHLIAKYSALNAANTFGDYSGSLGNRGERLALRQADGGMVDVVEYRDAGRWGKWADGGGSSLELIDPASDNRRSSNWADSDETQDAAWGTFELSDTIRYAINDAEELHICSLSGGEYIFDDIEVLDPNGVNMLSGWNTDFEGTRPASNHWLFLGNHVRTTIEPGAGAGGSAGMHVRATRAGNFFANRCEVDLVPAYTNGTPLTIKVKARWVAGHDSFMFRLLGSGMELIIDLPTPPEPGSPGEVNTKRIANAAPTIWDVIHQPILPQVYEDVVVTARVDDPDGVSALNLIYHLDMSNATSVTEAMVDNGTGGDKLAGDGIYSATIPGQDAYAMMAFRVEATDANSLVSVFPDDAPLHEGLIRWGEMLEPGTFQDFRMWIRQGDIDVWQTYDELENEPVPATLVLDDYRVIYGSEIRYRGNIGSRHNLFADGPTGTVSGSFAPIVPNDQRLFNTDRLNINLIGQTWEDKTLMREKAVFWYMEQMGMPTQPSRYAHFLVNGNKGGPVYYEMCQLGDKEWRWGFYPDRDEGDLHKALAYREVNDEFAAIANTLNGSTVIPARLFAFRNPDGSLRKARYRWTWPRKGTNGKVNDDWSNFFDLVEAFDTQGDLEDYRIALEQQVNMDQWLLANAVRHAVGGQDTISYGGAHNNHIYKPPGERWELLERDVDTAFGRSAANVGTYSPEESIFFIRDYVEFDVLMERTFSTPAFRRIYMDHLRRSYDVLDGPLYVDNFCAHVEAWGDALEANSLSPDRFDVMKDWVTRRRAQVMSELPNASFAVTDVDYTTSDNLGIIEGTAPVEAHTILINGSPYPVVWLDDATWQVEVPLVPGQNPFQATALDAAGNALAGFTDQINITKTGPVTSPVGNIVINEIDYHAFADNADFIEIYNQHSTDTFDLSGWTVDGAGLTMPGGTLLGPGEFLIFAEDAASLRIAHGMLPIAGEYDGTLRNDAEVLRLYDSASNQVDIARYQDAWPWPATADGNGPSLQRIDAAQTGLPPANWEASLSVPTTPMATNSNARVLPTFPPLVMNEVNPKQSWCEVYSPNLFAMSDINLTDDPSDPTKYPVINQNMNGARQYVLPGMDPTAGVVAVVWTPPGETLVLSALPYDKVGAGHSWGLFPNGDVLSPMLFHKPTPNVSNNPTSIPAEMVINEWLASNQTGALDPADMDADDWIELFNNGSTAADLSWYSLSDDATDPKKYILPAGSIFQAGDHPLFWADGEPGQGPNHMDFKLSASGETITLYAPDGSVVDTVTFGQQTADQSEGRWKDGEPAPFWSLGVNTPGAPNQYVLFNTAPIIMPANQSVMFGMPMSVSIPAFDLEAPPQSLTFSLDGGPGAIHPTTGLYTWTPSAAQAGTTHIVNVRATDNDLNPASSVMPFTITVAPQMMISPQAFRADGTISWPTAPGLRYTVLVCDDLKVGNWTVLQTVTATTSVTSMVDADADLPTLMRRAYRIRYAP